MRYKEPYSLFLRKLKSGRKIYYYSIYDGFNRRKQYSTGCTKKIDAKRYCNKLFHKERVTIVKDIKFSTYTKDWFDYDTCKYIQSILIRGQSYSRMTAKVRKGTLLRYILPYFGNMYLQDIKPCHIEDWIIELKKHKIANITTNKYVGVLKIVLNEAYRRGDITYNPVTSIKALKDDSKGKNILTQDEVSRLLDESKKDDLWKDDSHYLMNLLASQSGMRMGEIQALRIECLKKDHIVVKYSWDRSYRLKETKTGQERIVPITTDLYNQLHTLYLKNGTEGPFIFSTDKGLTPLCYRNVTTFLYEALKGIGIEEEERRERVITFHSWRSYYNTYLITKGISLPIIQAIIGHNSNRMTRHYTKLKVEDLKKVL